MPCPKVRCWPIVAVDVEPVRVGEPAVVAVGGVVEEQHGAPRGHGLPVELDVLGDVAAGDRTRRLEPQQLLDRVVDERPVLDELAPLIGVLAEHLAGPADEPVRRLVAGAGDDVHVEERFIAGQACGSRRARPRTPPYSSSVMTSSEGCSARQSMYSPKMSAASTRVHFEPFENRIGLPGSVRR